MTIKGRVIVCPGVVMNVFVNKKAASLRGSGGQDKEDKNSSGLKFWMIHRLARPLFPYKRKVGSTMFCILRSFQNQTQLY